MFKSFLTFFSIPIFTGIIAGIIFPFKALELIFISNTLLFILMFLNSLVIDSSQLLSWRKQDLRNSLIFVGLMFILFPCVQINLAQMFLGDVNYLFGYALSCLAPTAFVAPFFCKVRHAEAKDGISNIFVSTLLFPVASFIFLTFLLRSTHFVDTQSVLALVLLITFLPMALGLGISRLLPTVRTRLLPYNGVMNSLLLGALMFILCGSSFNKLRLSHLLEPDIITIIFLLLFMDFGVYYLMKYFAGAWLDRARAEALAISVSMRNLAIPAGLLLSFQPKAAIVPALGLVIHAFFFQWLARPPKTPAD
jgi:predicted Na+-dependent transporter